MCIRDRKVLDAAATHEHHGVLLQVVADAGDIGRDFHPIDKPDAGDLAQGGVGLLGGGGIDARADSALLGRTLERRRGGALRLALAPLAYELAYGCHLTSL